MLKKLKILSILALLLINPIIAFSQDSQVELQQTHRTLLPQSNETSNVGCTIIIKRFKDIYNFGINPDGTNEELATALNDASSGSITRFFAALDIMNVPRDEDEQYTQDDILGCAIITGRIQFSYLSIFLFYILSWLSVASGIVSMFFIIIGGYKYIIGGLTEKQDEGKNTITYAIYGLIVSTGAWMLVALIQSFVSR